MEESIIKDFKDFKNNFLGIQNLILIQEDQIRELTEKLSNSDLINQQMNKELKNIIDVNNFQLKTSLEEINQNYNELKMNNDLIILEQHSLKEFKEKVEAQLVTLSDKFAKLNKEFLEEVKETRIAAIPVDKLWKEIKYLKIAEENIRKSIVDQKTTMEKDFHEFVQNKIYFKDLDIIKKFDIYDGEIKAIKIENGKYHLEAMKEVKSLKIEKDKFFELKEQTENDLNNDRTILQETKEELLIFKHQFNLAEKTHSEINETIKELRHKVSNLCTLVQTGKSKKSDDVNVNNANNMQRCSLRACNCEVKHNQKKLLTKDLGLVSCLKTDMNMPRRRSSMFEVNIDNFKR